MAKKLTPRNQLPTEINNFPERGDPMEIAPLENAIQVVLDRTENIHTRTTTLETSGAPKLQTARTIALSGDVSGSTLFDGSANVAIIATIEDYAITTAKIADSAITDTKIGDRTIVDTTPPSNNGNLTTLLGGLANRIKAITGGMAWTDNPTTTITELNANAARKGANETITGSWTFTSTITGNLGGNASTASKLQTARAIALSGDVSGSATFDGSADATITTTIGASAITTTKVADGAITTAKIANAAITTTKIADLGTATTGQIPFVSGGNLATSTGLVWDEVSHKLSIPSIQITSGAGVGKVLTSDASGNASWQTPSGSSYTIRRPSLYKVPSISSAGLSGTTLTAQTIYFVPFIAANQVVLTDLGFNVTTAASGTTTSVGIYSNTYNSTNGDRPSTLLASSNAINTDTTGFKNYTLGTPITLNPNTLYWLAIASSGAPTLSAIFPSDAIPIGIYAGSTTHITGLTGPTTGSTLPTTAPSTLSNYTGYPPAIFYRLAL